VSRGSRRTISLTLAAGQDGENRHFPSSPTGPRHCRKRTGRLWRAAPTPWISAQHRRPLQHVARGTKRAALSSRPFRDPRCHVGSPKRRLTQEPRTVVQADVREKRAYAVPGRSCWSSRPFRDRMIDAPVQYADLLGVERVGRHRRGASGRRRTRLVANREVVTGEVAGLAYSSGGLSSVVHGHAADEVSATVCQSAVQVTVRVSVGVQVSAEVRRTRGKNTVLAESSVKSLGWRCPVEVLLLDEPRPHAASS
jgi:hypothetical protein